MRKLWTNRYRISKTTKNAWVDQEKFLVARNNKQHQEVHSKMHKMSTEQSATYEESRGNSSIGNINI